MISIENFIKDISSPPASYEEKVVFLKKLFCTKMYSVFRAEKFAKFAKRLYF